MCCRMHCAFFGWCVAAVISWHAAVVCGQKAIPPPTPVAMAQDTIRQIQAALGIKFSQWFFSQFDRIIKTGSFDELLRRMREKTLQLEKSENR